MKRCGRRLHALRILLVVALPAAAPGAMAAAPGWQRPVRYTRTTQPAYNADYCPAAGKLAVTVSRDGGADILIFRDAPSSLTPGRDAAPHSARDRWPRFSLDGKRMLFVSHRQDPAGDIWLKTTARWPLKARLRRLTDQVTSDDQPCWHPDGRRIFYASAKALGERYELYEMQLGGEVRPLTTSGGQMPSCSPDGRFLAFVREDKRGGSNICALRLADGKVAELTAGPEIDLCPCWDADGKRILFARREFDTDDSGRLDRKDASSIFAVDFSEGVFSGDGAPAPRQLTSYATSETFPRPLADGFLFTMRTGAENADVFRLPAGGEMPPLGGPSAFLKFARSVERRQEGAHHRVLAWRNALWAARRAGQAPAAVVWLQLGRAYLQLGCSARARAAFQSAVDGYPSSDLQTGLARLELLALERKALSRQDEAGWQKHLESARGLEEQFRALAAGAGLNVAAGARLETGRSLLESGGYAEALAAFEAVPLEYPQQAGACARALLGLADVYRVLNEPSALRETYLRLLEDYPGQSSYGLEAARGVIATIVRPGAKLGDKLAGLRRLVEEHSSLSLLPALAQNLIGDLFYGESDYAAALKEYQRTIERFPAERRQVAAARLAIGHIRLEQGNYARAVEALGGAQDVPDALKEKVRSALARALLLKGEREIQLGDPGVALNTYRSLAEVGRRVAAQRGIVECYARLGRVEEVIRECRERLHMDPQVTLTQYKLALAYSYFGPSDWAGPGGPRARRIKIDREALRLVEQALRSEPEVAYYHQLRGFLLNRLARATGRNDYKVNALDAYLSALSLSEAGKDAANYANALFNVGEGYLLVDRPEGAFDYYQRALAAGFELTGARGRVALRNISRSALAAGRYGYAAELLERALTAAKGIEDDTERLRWKAQILDRLAFTYQMDGAYLDAVDRYRDYTDKLVRLIKEGAAPAYRRNLLRGYRNLAVNLYLAYEQDRAERASLDEARELLREAVERLDRIGAVQWEKKGGGGLVTVEVQVSLSESGRVGVFDASAERRLLYTYLARIYAAAGDYGQAVHYMKEKLARYPKLPAKTDQTGLITEQAVTWSQIGDYQARRGRLVDSTQAYGRAVELERRAGNLQGEATDAISLGRALIQAAQRDGAEGVSAAMLREALRMHRTLIEQVRKSEEEPLVEEEAALKANLTALLEMTPAKDEGAGGAKDKG